MSQPVELGPLTRAMNASRLTGGTAVFLTDRALTDVHAVERVKRALDEMPDPARAGLVIGAYDGETADLTTWMKHADTFQLQKHLSYRQGAALDERVARRLSGSLTDARLVPVDAQGLETTGVPQGIRVLPSAQAAARETLKSAAALAVDTTLTPFERLRSLLTEARRLRDTNGVRWSSQAGEVPTTATPAYQMALGLALLGVPTVPGPPGRTGLPTVGDEDLRAGRPTAADPDRLRGDWQVLDLDPLTRSVLPVTTTEVLDAFTPVAGGERVDPDALYDRMKAVPGSVAMVRTGRLGQGEDRVRWMVSLDNDVFWVDAEVHVDPLTPVKPVFDMDKTTPEQRAAGQRAADLRMAELRAVGTTVVVRDASGTPVPLAELAPVAAPVPPAEPRPVPDPAVTALVDGLRLTSEPVFVFATGIGDGPLAGREGPALAPAVLESLADGLRRQYPDGRVLLVGPEPAGDLRTTSPELFALQDGLTGPGQLDAALTALNTGRTATVIGVSGAVGEVSARLGMRSVRLGAGPDFEGTGHTERAQLQRLDVPIDWPEHLDRVRAAAGAGDPAALTAAIDAWAASVERYRSVLGTRASTPSDATSLAGATMSPEVYEPNGHRLQNVDSRVDQFRANFAEWLAGRLSSGRGLDAGRARDWWAGVAAELDLDDILRVFTTDVDELVRRAVDLDREYGAALWSKKVKPEERDVYGVTDALQNRPAFPEKEKGEDQKPPSTNPMLQPADPELPRNAVVLDNDLVRFALLRKPALWMRLRDFQPYMLEDHPGGEWHFLTTADGEMWIASEVPVNKNLPAAMEALADAEAALATATPEQAAALAEAARKAAAEVSALEESSVIGATQLRALHQAWRAQGLHPDATLADVVEVLNTVGHPAIAGQDHTDPTSPATITALIKAAQARVSGELHLLSSLGGVVDANTKSGRFMAMLVRNQTPEQEEHWASNAARRVSAQLGMPIRLGEMKYAKQKQKGAADDNPMRQPPQPIDALVPDGLGGFWAGKDTHLQIRRISVSGRDVLLLVPDAEWQRLRGRNWLPKAPDGGENLPVVVVHNQDGYVRVPAIKDGVEGAVLLTPNQLKQVTEGLGKRQALISCEIADLNPAFVRAYTTALGGAVLASRTNVLGGTVDALGQGRPLLTDGDDAWRLFEAGRRDGQPVELDGFRSVAFPEAFTADLRSPDGGVVFSSGRTLPPIAEETTGTELQPLGDLTVPPPPATVVSESSSTATVRPAPTTTTPAPAAAAQPSRAASALRARLPQAARIKYTDGDLKELDRVQREAFGGRAGTDDGYAEMVQRLLLRNDGVTAANLDALAELVRDERALNRRIPTRVRNTAANVGEMLHLRGLDKSSRPGLLAAVRDPGRATVDGLVRAAMARHWPSADRPAGGLPPGAADAAFEHEVPGLQYAYDFTNAEALRDWLLSLLPVRGAQIDLESLKLQMTRYFTSLPDEGVPLRVTAGGETYSIQLLGDVTGAPRKLDDKAMSARLETHVNVTEEMQNLMSRTWNAAAEIGFANRNGLRLIAAMLAYITAGVTGGAGRSGAPAVSTTDYTTFKPSEEIYAVGVPLTFSAIVRREGQGDQPYRHETWRNPDGTPRQEAAHLYVGETQVPDIPNQAYDVPRHDAVPLWRMHIGIERIKAARALRKAVYDTIGAAEYAFWQVPLERFLSQDPLAAVVLKAYHHDAGFQERPRLMLRDGDRHLTLTLTATANRVVVPDKKTDKVVVDRDRVTITKPSQAQDTRKGVRATAGGALRFLAGLIAPSGKFSLSRLKGYQKVLVQRIESRSGRRSESLKRPDKDSNRVHRVESMFQAHIAWGSDHLTYRAQTAPVNGYVLGRIRDDEWNAVHQRFTAPAPDPAQPPSRVAPWASTDIPKLKTGEVRSAWWSPTQDGRHGIVNSAAAAVNGIDGLYDSLVRYLVSANYLPEAAAPQNGRTPWQHLQSLASPGHDLNHPGVRYDNWRLLIERVSSDYLTTRSYDLTSGNRNSPGMALTFRGEGLQKNLTIGLTSLVGTSSTYVESDKIWNRNGHIAQVGVGARRTTIATLERSRDTVGVIGNSDWVLPDPGQAANPGAVHTRSKTHRETLRAGELVYANAQTLNIIKVNSSKFNLGTSFRWWAYEGTSKTPKAVSTSALPASMDVWQADNFLPPSWQKDAADGDPARLLPELTPLSDPTTPAESPLNGFTMLGAVSASGVADLRDAVAKTVDAGWGQILDSMNLTWYKSSLAHSMQGGVPVALGTEEGLLRVQPVGRPQIVHKFKIYNDYTLEGQTGSTRDIDVTNTQTHRIGAGWRTGIAGDSGGATYGWGDAQGQQRQADSTAGAYRTYHTASERYMVRTRVENVYRTADGREVRTSGEAMVMISPEELHSRPDLYDQFDRPDGIKLPGASDAAGADWVLPVSVQHGRPWTGSFLDPIGMGQLRTDMGRAAKELGGNALEVQVMTRLVGLMTHMGELTDDGKSWEIKIGRRTFTMTVSRVLGDGAYVTRAKDDRLKQYTRVNEAASGQLRRTTIRTYGVTGGASTFNRGVADEASMPVNGNLSRASSKDDAQGRTANMLSMSGARPKDVAKFRQQMTTVWELREETSLVSPQSWRDRTRSGSVTETRPFWVPFEALRHRGETPVDLSGVRLGNLPDSARILGVQAMRALADAVTLDLPGDKLSSRDRAKPVPVGSLDALTNAKILSQYRMDGDFREAQRATGGIDVAGLNTGARRLRLADGTKVAARFGTVRDVFHINSIELEMYEHGMQGISQSSMASARYAGDASGNALVPVKPMVYVGGRFVISGDYTRGRGTNRVQASEHRSWVRTTYPQKIEDGTKAGAYQVFADIDLTVSLPSGKTRTATGSTEFVVGHREAVTLGLDPTLLERIRAERIVVPTGGDSKRFFRVDGGKRNLFEAVHRSLTQQGGPVPSTVTDGSGLREWVSAQIGAGPHGADLPDPAQVLLTGMDPATLHGLVNALDRPAPAFNADLEAQVRALAAEEQMAAEARNRGLDGWQPGDALDGFHLDEARVGERLDEARLLHLLDHAQTALRENPAGMARGVQSVHHGTGAMSDLAQVYIDAGRLPTPGELLHASLGNEPLFGTPAGDITLGLLAELLQVRLHLVDDGRATVYGDAAAPEVYVRRGAGTFHALEPAGAFPLAAPPVTPPVAVPAVPPLASGALPPPAAVDSAAAGTRTPAPAGTPRPLGDDGTYVDDNSEFWRRAGDGWQPVARVEQQITVAPVFGVEYDRPLFPALDPKSLAVGEFDLTSLLWDVWPVREELEKLRAFTRSVVPVVSAIATSGRPGALDAGRSWKTAADQIGALHRAYAKLHSPMPWQKRAFAQRVLDAAGAIDGAAAQLTRVNPAAAGAFRDGGAVRDVTVAGDGTVLADGFTVLTEGWVEPDGRTVVGFVPEADLIRATLPEGTRNVVAVRTEGGFAHVPVRRADGTVHDVLMTGRQIAAATRHLSGPLDLVFIGAGGPDSAFTRSFRPAAGTAPAPRLLGAWSGPLATQAADIRRFAEAAGRPVVAADLSGPPQTSGPVVAELREVMTGFTRMGVSPIVVTTEATKASGELFESVRRDFGPVLIQPAMAGWDRVWLLQSADGEGRQMESRLGAEIFDAAGKLPGDPPKQDTGTALPEAVGEWTMIPLWADALTYHRAHQAALHTPASAAALADAVAAEPGNARLAAFRTVLDVARTAGGLPGPGDARLTPTATSILEVEKTPVAGPGDRATAGFVYDYLSTIGPRADRFAMDGLLWAMMMSGALTEQQGLSLVRATAVTQTDKANLQVFESMLKLRNLSRAELDGDPMTHPPLRAIMDTIGDVTAAYQRGPGEVRNPKCVDPIDRTAWIGRLDALRDAARVTNPPLAAAVEVATHILTNC
ncbi:hypothetical protein [Catenuloplanes indicus]|uniref:Uncharacterized protein n=1 Tax=Catenuloplanes indicus TaxID=137267 RepID=A0AAE3W7L5_9ACTN|nr:hypothetical protein [Catenuloplanes indicus]MDQ0369982.1 hypothetical protein [Catenuloplanes indicus]